MLAQAIEARISLPQFPLKQVETEWIVITGASSSGKTTLVKDVAKALGNCPIQPDAGREILDVGLDWRGPNKESFKIDEILGYRLFDDTVFARRLDRHFSYTPDKVCLLDYGLPDVIVFREEAGWSFNHMLDRAGLFHYKRVFILESLPYENDRVRNWTEPQRAAHRAGLEKWYRHFGFSPILVPPLLPEARRDFVLERIW